MTAPLPSQLPCRNNPKTALTIPQYFLSNCVQGMDAMTHAVEAYVSTISTPLTGEWSRAAKEWLPSIGGSSSPLHRDQPRLLSAHVAPLSPRNPCRRLGAARHEAHLLLPPHRGGGRQQHPGLCAAARLAAACVPCDRRGTHGAGTSLPPASTI